MVVRCSCCHLYSSLVWMMELIQSFIHCFLYSLGATKAIKLSTICVTLDYINSMYGRVYIYLGLSCTTCFQPSYQDCSLVGKMKFLCKLFIYLQINYLSTDCLSIYRLFIYLQIICLPTDHLSICRSFSDVHPRIWGPVLQELATYDQVSFF